MKIDNNNQVYFKANFVNRIKIGKFNKGKYTNGYASFVKIDPFNNQDINALKDCADYWEINNFNKFTTNIHFVACAMKNKSKFYENHNIYVITSQQKGFQNLDGNKILGLVHTSPYLDSPLFIEHIQVNPEYLYKENAGFKGIGTSILNSLKRISNMISCFPAHEKTIQDFYTKNGFIKQPGSHNYYVWQKK